MTNVQLTTLLCTLASNVMVAFVIVSGLLLFNVFTVVSRKEECLFKCFVLTAIKYLTIILKDDQAT